MLDGRKRERLEVEGIRRVFFIDLKFYGLLFRKLGIKNDETPTG